MTVNPALTTLPVRPTCPCHGEPMWRLGTTKAGRQQWRCRVKEGARNAERIRVGGDSVFVGRAHRFGTTKQNVKAFITRTREEHHGKNR